MRLPGNSAASARRAGGLLAGLVASLLGTDAGEAAEIVPSLSATVAFSDNVRLAPSGAEEEDFIGVIQPGISISSLGQRYDFALDYRLQAVFYADQEDADEAYSIGQARLQVEALPERFFVTGSAQISQTVVEPGGRVPNSNLPILGNRQDQTTLRITPEWRQPIGSADLTLQATAGKLLFSEDGLQDVDFIEVANRLQGPQADRGFTWALRHNFQQYDYQVTKIKRQAADLSVGFELGTGWAPFAAVGRESDFANPTDASLNFTTWQAGLRRTTERSRFEISSGERSFGSNFRLLLERNVGAETGNFIRASYAESPRTVEELAAISVIDPLDPDAPPPLVDPGLPPDLPPELFPPGTGVAFLQRRAELVFGWNPGKVTLLLTLFDQDNERIPAVSDPVNTTDVNNQSGVTLVADYAVGRRLGVFANLRITDRTFEQDEALVLADTVTTGRLGLRYNLGERTRLSGWIGTQRRTDVEGSASQVPFQENQVGITLARDFN